LRECDLRWGKTPAGQAEHEPEEELMDRNDSNPGMVERQMDDSPMEGASSSDRELSRDGMGGMDRQSGEQGGSPERESMEATSGSADRDSLTGRESDSIGLTNTNSNDAQMRVSAQEGGYGYDRPADLTVNRDTMESSSRDTDQGTDRVRNVSGTDQPGGTNTARDW
jgi:hypothetical protein